MLLLSKGILPQGSQDLSRGGDWAAALPSEWQSKQISEVEGGVGSQDGEPGLPLLFFLSLIFLLYLFLYQHALDKLSVLYYSLSFDNSQIVFYFLETETRAGYENDYIWVFFQPLWFFFFFPLKCACIELSYCWRQRMKETWSSDSWLHFGSHKVLLILATAVRSMR